METVHKFELQAGDTIVDMPVGAEVLSAHFQGDKFMLWALVDTEKPTEQRHFVTAGTGHKITWDADQLDFIGTGFYLEMGLVFHAFELR